jgi:hypothetical protein
MTTEGNVPIPIKKVAAKDICLDLLTMSRSQPTAEIVKAAMRKMPRFLK